MGPPRTHIAHWAVGGPLVCHEPRVQVNRMLRAVCIFCEAYEPILGVSMLGRGKGASRCVRSEKKIVWSRSAYLGSSARARGYRHGHRQRQMGEIRSGEEERA